MSTKIIDYGLCNLGSVLRACKIYSNDVAITNNPSDLFEASHVILPGVGAFSEAMESLDRHGWVDAIRDYALVLKRPLLGICLGMQLLADVGEEGGDFKGLSLIRGRIKKFNNKSIRVPHVGWNEVSIQKESRILMGIANKTDFYFVHSYYFSGVSEQDKLLTTHYGDCFVSGIERDNVFGFQFHPEKSGKSGLLLIKNFMSL